jgi:eukaryotic translation initiation factor 2C
MADKHDLSRLLRPERYKDRQTGKETWVMSEAFRLVRRLHKLKFTVNHRSKMGVSKTYTVRQVIFNGEEYGPKGAVSREVKFDKKQPDGTTRNTSVWQHFLEAYNIRLQWPDLPIIESTRGGMFPMELCTAIDFQRYQFKLDPEQVSDY